MTEESGCTFHHFSSPEQLENANLHAIAPRYIFVPHWSWILPEAIWGRFETIIFHMTDLPFGRGGSPLQNMIARGLPSSVLTAFRCTKELDAAPVYLKLPFSLEGSAQEIFLRASHLAARMILRIINEEPIPEPQSGEPVYFSRRKPAESEIKNPASIKDIYDHIRMLDAEGYPRAFINVGSFRLEFGKAAYNRGNLEAQVTISEIHTQKADGNACSKK